jgi:adenosylmethionine-8-amino-7-oxononanoate aminotransferase
VSLTAGPTRLACFAGAYHGELGWARAVSTACGVHRDLPRGMLVLPSPRCDICPVGRDPRSCRAQCLDPLARSVRKGRVILTMEPVQTTNGCLLPAPPFADRLRRIRVTAGERLILIADEVACGLHRAGPAFAQELLGVRADITALGKALTSGLVPLSAMLLSGTFVDRIRRERGHQEFAFGSTYDGYQIGVEAAHATLDAMHALRVSERAARLGLALANGLRVVTPVASARVCGALAVVHVPNLDFERFVARVRQMRYVVHAEEPHLLLLPPLVMSRVAAHVMATQIGALVRELIERQTRSTERAVPCDDTSPLAPMTVESMVNRGEA